jgi:hypothetical protein
MKAERLRFAMALRHTKAAHGMFEVKTGNRPHDWADWYSGHLFHLGHYVTGELLRAVADDHVQAVKAGLSAADQWPDFYADSIIVGGE